MTDPSLLGENSILLGDSLRLGQVLANLLSNAVKFTHHGYVMLSVDIDERDDDGVTLRFTVRDTGIGMTADQVAGLFQEFSQADGSATREYGGTGLGLSISKRLVNLMGGEISVNSSKNEGSSFSFTTRFPVSDSEPQPVVLPGLESLRVLVVDDMSEARRVLVGLLSSLGVGSHRSRGVECTDGAVSALSMIRQARQDGHPYDLVMLDWNMPNMGGDAFLSELEKTEVSPPQTIIVSAHDPDIAPADAGTNARMFLPKPVLPESLRDLLSSLTCRNEMAEQPEVERRRRTGGDRRIHDRRQEKDRKVGNADRRTGGEFGKSDDSLDGMRVLLVEDNAVNQRLATELMRIRRVSVDVANDGREALDILERPETLHYDAVLMDLQMPVMDGYETTRHLRANPKYKNLPIIAMTAYAMPEEREHCLAMGMNEHVSKPIEPDILYATLARFHPASPRNDGKGKQRPPYESSNEAMALPLGITGLDATEGLCRAAGMIDLYRHVLNDFVLEFADFGDEFQRLLDSEQWKDAERRAHTLKGLAGTIGAPPVMSLAETLENLCAQQKREETVEALTAVLKQLSPLIMALRNYGAGTEIAAREPSKSSDATPLEQSENLIVLCRLLVEGDNDAIDLWNTHKGSFSDGLSSRAVQRIDHAINNYEFDAALGLLQELQTGE